MAVNEVIINGEKVVDLTDTTATEETVVEGVEFYDASGIKRTGSAVIPKNLSQLKDDVGYAKQSEVDNLSEEIVDLSNSIPNVPVKSVNGKTGAVVLNASDVGAITQEYVDNEITDLETRLGQQHLLFAEGEEVEDALEWLETNGDASKVYVLPDGFFYEKKETIVESGGVAYTNKLPQATGTDLKTIYGGDYNGDGVNDGYKISTRLSGSSGSEATSNALMCASGFIPAKAGDVVRIQNTMGVTSVQAYIITYNGTTRVANKNLVADSDKNNVWTTYGVNYYTYDAEKNILTITLSSANFGSDFTHFRFSAHMDNTTIVTVNEEIKEGGGTAIVEKWVSTGQALVPTDYDEEIARLTDTTDAHTKVIKELQENAINGTPLTDDEKLNRIREWDAPIYDAHIPVFELTTEKTAKTNATNTPDTIYAMYDALMAKYPRYITKTDLGLCSDGVNHIYRYDFREPEPYHQSNMPWSETKTKAILVSGIHYEWAGIYSLYYALEEITENPKLYDLRRNTHFIVIPVINPYCTITSNYNASMGVLNANGVQIHRNFEIGFIYPNESGYVEAGNRNHGGIEPLSEIETQCLDNIFKENTDSAFFLTCHNFDSPSSTNGLGFIWPSSATKYMCNMGYRLIDKMTKAWLDKWGDDLEAGIEDYRTDNVTDDFIRFGHAHMSNTDGTETRQATKYGIQGNNVEVCMRFYPHGTTENVEPSLSEFTLSRGAETYVNFLLTACGVYDYKDKEAYYK